MLDVIQRRRTRMERMRILSGAMVTRPTRVAMSTTMGGGEKGGVVVVGIGSILHSILPPISGVHVSDHMSALKSICDFWFIYICE